MVKFKRRDSSIKKNIFNTFLMYNELMNGSHNSVNIVLLIFYYNFFCYFLLLLIKECYYFFVYIIKRDLLDVEEFMRNLRGYTFSKI